MHLERSEDEEEAGEHQASEGHEVQAGQGFGQPLVIAGQPSEARRPRKAAFYHPPARQQDEPRLAWVCLTTSSRMPCVSAAAAASCPV